MEKIESGGKYPDSYLKVGIVGFLTLSFLCTQAESTLRPAATDAPGGWLFSAILFAPSRVYGYTSLA